jgi:hypothetical protein
MMAFLRGLRVEAEVESGSIIRGKEPVELCPTEQPGIVLTHKR